MGTCCSSCLQLFFGVVRSFIGLSLNCTPHITFRGIAICRARRPDFRGDVVAEIFSLPTLCSACVAWYGVLLPDIGSASCHLLDLGQLYLIQALDVDDRVNSEAMQQGKLEHYVIITSDHPNHDDVGCVFDFHQCEYDCLPTDIQTL